MLDTHTCPRCGTVRPWSSYEPIGVKHGLDFRICPDPECGSTTARELPEDRPGEKAESRRVAA